VTFEARFVVIVLAAFAWSSLAAALIVPIVFRRLQRQDSVVRAQSLVRLRALPALVGAGTALVAATSFLLFEPRTIDEDYGVILKSLALLPLAFFAGSMVRGSLGWFATSRLMRALTRNADPVTLPGIVVPAVVVDSEFPIVAVVGVVRPRLVVARSVLTHCPADELEAILAHEQAHIDRRDNLSRLALSAMPDVLAWLPVSARIRAAWQESAEHAADDTAGRGGQEGRLVLAQALLRVARLAGGPVATALPLPTSALYRGEDLTRRVARLMQPLPPAASSARWSRWAVSIVLVACGATLEALHELVEVAVAFLP
jgi:Zn-dependent protease with chaperone function